MNISSLNSSWLLSQSMSALSNTTGNNAVAIQGTASTGNVTGNSTNNGDTFQLSLAAQMMNSTMQPQSSNNNISNDLSTLLTKVQGGTATSTDFQSMASELQQVVQASNFQNQTSNSGNICNDIDSFLGKVANGTASSSDLKNMQNELQQVQQSGSGSVQSYHHHHHHHDGGAASNTQNATTSDSIGSDLSSFMDKVVKGTATDSDLTNMEAEMAPLLQASGIQQPASTNSSQGVSSVASSNTNSISNVQNLNAVSQAFSNLATNAYNTQAYFGFITPPQT